MKAWWSALAERERRLVLLAATVLVVGLFYGALWAPLQRGVAVRRERVAVLRGDLAWMRNAAAQLLLLRAQPSQVPAAGGTAAPGATLAIRIRRSAHRAGLPVGISGLAGTGHGAVAATLAPARFAEVMRWLAALQAQGIAVRGLALDGAGAGQVQGRVELAVMQRTATGAR